MRAFVLIFLQLTEMSSTTENHTNNTRDRQNSVDLLSSKLCGSEPCGSGSSQTVNELII